MSTIQLQEISWPVFRLGEQEPKIEGEVIYYASNYVTEDDEVTAKFSFKIVDDKSVDKPTLGQRRLVISETTKLFKINTAIYFLAELIKLAKSTTWFIDSVGKLFKLKKTTRAKLKNFKLKQVLPANGIGCVVEVEGLVTRFKSLIQPKLEEKYVVLLHFNKVYLFYGFSETPVKETWRLV